MEQDTLLRYAVALDAGDLETLGDIIEQAEKNDGLDQAIFVLHTRFDAHEGFAAQLQRLRERAMQ